MFTAPVSGLLWKRSNRASAKLVGEPTDDLGRLAEVVDLLAVPQAASWTRPSPPRSLMDRPAVTSPPGQSLVDRPTGTSLLTESLTVSMRRWFDVAAGIVAVDGFDELLSPSCTAEGRDQLTEFTAWLASADSVRPLQAIAAAQHPTVAAYAARDALVHEDPSVSRDTVARFAGTWRGFRPTDEIVEAAAAALPYAPLDEFDPDDNSTASPQAAVGHDAA
jgi:hypothetical protein